MLGTCAPGKKSWSRSCQFDDALDDASATAFRELLIAGAALQPYRNVEHLIALSALQLYRNTALAALQLYCELP